MFKDSSVSSLSSNCDLIFNSGMKVNVFMERDLYRMVQGEVFKIMNERSFDSEEKKTEFLFDLKTLIRSYDIILIESGDFVDIVTGECVGSVYDLF